MTKEQKRKYQREWWRKNKSKATNQKQQIKHSSLNGDLPEVIKAFQVLMGATENGQTKAELTKCFTSIIVGGLV